MGRLPARFALHLFRLKRGEQALGCVISRPTVSRNQGAEFTQPRVLFIYFIARLSAAQTLRDCLLVNVSISNPQPNVFLGLFPRAGWSPARRARGDASRRSTRAATAERARESTRARGGGAPGRAENASVSLFHES